MTDETLAKKPDSPEPAAPREPPSSDSDAVVAEFRAFLQTVNPRLRVVPAVFAVNAAVFAIMVLAGVDAFAPDAERMIAWGASWGPKTLGAQPWRMLTQFFLHFGAFHLLMNMVALGDAGRLVERLYGSARFAAIYLAAGLGGSIASLAVHPQVVSAGASGAVFGVYGALAGFLLRERDAIPRPVLSKLGGVAAGFVAYNMLFGLAHPQVDVAAHLGGLVVGALAGAYLARPLAPGRRDPPRRIVIVGIACAAAVALAYVGLPQLPRVPLTRHELPGFSVELPPGELDEKSSTAYRAGVLTRKGDRDGILVVVVWEPGTSRESLETLAKRAARNFRDARTATLRSTPGPDGASVATAALDSDSATMRISSLDCGRRVFTIATSGPLGADALHARIVRTARCSPDPRLEATVTGIVPVRLELPGWYAVQRSAGVVSLSDDRSWVVLRDDVVSSTPFDDRIRAWLGRLEASVTVTPDGADEVTFTGTLRGAPVHGWARQLRCDGGAVTILLGSPDVASAQTARALASSARCAAPGEEPSTWPDNAASAPRDLAPAARAPETGNREAPR